MTHRLGIVLAWLAAGCVARPATLAPVAHVEVPACFPVDTLPPALRALAERVLLEAGDGEALYTLAGGLKPLSSGRSFSFEIAPVLEGNRVDSLEQLRRATNALTCGDIGASVHLFAAVQRRRDSTQHRVGEVVVFHRASVAATVARHREFFATLGITPSADVREVLGAVENASRMARWRGYGLLFGYPDHAVDFFVRAGIEGDSTGTIVARDFLRIETFRKSPVEQGQPPTMSSFVYAVPKGSGETEADRRLRAAAAPVYARYVHERNRTVIADSSGAITLWRRWIGASAP